MMVASHINRYTDIILRRERLYVITCGGVWFYTVSHFTPKAGLGLPREVRYEFYETVFFFLPGRQQILSMVSADGGDVYPVVLVTEVCVTVVALHVPLEDMYATLSWYNSSMNVDTSNQ